MSQTESSADRVWALIEEIQIAMVVTHDDRDGVRGGFSALVNYHRLCEGNGAGRRLLEKTPAPVTICSKSSRSDMAADRRSSPPSSRSRPGTRLLAIPPTPTPFSTASCTMRTASHAHE
jgi:hypothetical protein